MKYFSLIIAVVLSFWLRSCAVNKSDAEPEDSENTPFVSDIVEEYDPENELTPIYDNTAIIEAYQNKDASSLDEKQLAVYNAALEAISEFYREGLSEEEIVLAAHDWIVTNVTYDVNMLLPIPFQTEDSENPYGALIKGQGICMGYTTTFQLFMNMLGVESIIIRGSGDGEEHAWNMVNLDGAWYHVDVTWNDFVPDEDDRPPFHIYFLVPDYAMEINHDWDRDAAPTATADDRIYYKSHELFAQTEKQSAAILKSAKESGFKYAEIMTPSNKEVTKYMYSYWPTDFGEYVITVYWIS